MADVLARTHARRLRMMILRRLGLPLLAPALACGGSTGERDDEAGVTTDPSGGGESNGEVTGMEMDPPATSESDDEAEVDTGDSIKLDLGPKYDVGGPPPADCWDELYWSAMEIPPEFAGCQLGPFDPLLPIYQQICVTKPESGECADICVDGWCEGMDECLYAYGPVLDVCGVFELDGECCSLIAIEEPPPVGRPFRVDGRPRLAALAADALELDPLAGHWLATARAEHASIAAFARFGADLLRFGAPAQLLAEALAAADDEVRHTGDALALASRFAGRPVELGALDVRSALARRGLEQAVREAVREGCIAETLAAHEAACLAARADDPQVAAVLDRVARDEARHAALAWRFVAWALAARPDLRPIVEQAFARGLAERPASSDPPGGLELLAFGCPPAALRARWRELGLRELVSPCADRLLARDRGAPATA